MSVSIMTKVTAKYGTGGSLKKTGQTAKPARIFGIHAKYGVNLNSHPPKLFELTYRGCTVIVGIKSLCYATRENKIKWDRWQREFFEIRPL
jgi:hypothetical protein